MADRVDKPNSGDESLQKTETRSSLKFKKLLTVAADRLFQGLDEFESSGSVEFTDCGFGLGTYLSSSAGLAKVIFCQMSSRHPSGIFFQANGATIAEVANKTIAKSIQRKNDFFASR